MATLTKLEKQYYVHVEFMITELFPSNGWYNIFRATISGSKYGYGSRTPVIAIKYTNGNMFIRIAAAINGTEKYAFNSPTTPVALNKWITIDASQTKVNNGYH